MLINHGIDSNEEEVLPLFASVHVDVLLNPFALLLCYYASVIFICDIANKKTEGTDPSVIHLEPLNGKNLQILRQFSTNNNINRRSMGNNSEIFI